MLDRMEAAARKAQPEGRRRKRRLELKNSLSKFFQEAWPHSEPALYTHGWPWTRLPNASKRKDRTLAV
jgi:hypothetical protein